jgi:hypothetical protein
MTGPRSKVLAPTVLRIIDGRLAGKEYPLAQDQRVCVGHALANDVVLRGAGTRGSTVELRLAGDAVQIRVLAGAIELLGRSMGPDEEAMLPAYLPFRFGEFVIAHGERKSARWAEVAQLAASPCTAPVAPLPPPHLLDRARALGGESVATVSERFGLARLAILAASGLLLIAAIQPIADVVTDSQASPGNMSRRLEEAGFHGLTVIDNPAGGLIVSGVVRDDKAAARLRAVTGQQGVPVMVDVTSSSTMAANATDILQAQGIDAKVEPAGLASIAVIGPFFPADRQASMRALLSKDLPGLRNVAFRIDDSRGGNALQAFFAGGNTGLATVVGDPGYIVTADGQRWFPGAVLPTGHKLVSVDGSMVRFEKDGRAEEIKL